MVFWPIKKFRLVDTFLNRAGSCRFKQCILSLYFTLFFHIYLATYAMKHLQRRGFSTYFVVLWTKYYIDLFGNHTKGRLWRLSVDLNRSIGEIVPLIYYTE